MAVPAPKIVKGSGTTPLRTTSTLSMANDSSYDSLKLPNEPVPLTNHSMVKVSEV